MSDRLFYTVLLHQLSSKFHAQLAAYLSQQFDSFRTWHRIREEIPSIMTHIRLVVFLVGSFNNISTIPLEHHAGLVAGKDGGKALVL